MRFYLVSIWECGHRPRRALFGPWRPGRMVAQTAGSKFVSDMDRQLIIGPQTTERFFCERRQFAMPPQENNPRAAHDSKL